MATTSSPAMLTKLAFSPDLVEACTVMRRVGVAWLTHSCSSPNIHVWTVLPCHPSLLPNAWHAWGSRFSSFRLTLSKLSSSTSQRFVAAFHCTHLPSSPFRCGCVCNPRSLTRAPTCRPGGGGDGLLGVAGSSGRWCSGLSGGARWCSGLPGGARWCGGLLGGACRCSGLKRTVSPFSSLTSHLPTPACHSTHAPNRPFRAVRPVKPRTRTPLPARRSSLQPLPEAPLERVVPREHDLRTSCPAWLAAAATPFGTGNTSGGSVL
mmetsp:Transcript_115299/g.337088  ORF Transcript_115299/g.337088 Transcript_115299/m.337088 type:complete len:264 (-) Transcript_115299:235-1026(-)